MDGDQIPPAWLAMHAPGGGGASPSPEHLIDALKQQGRPLLEARMLPEEGLLTDAQVAEVTAALKDYIARHGITHAAIARQIGGIRANSLGELLAGKYRVTPEKRDEHLRDLNNWMEVDARRRASCPQRKFVETGVATVLLSLAEQAVSGQFMAVAYGPTGIGKTMVAHALVDRYPGTIYVRVSTGNTRHVSLRRLLAATLRIREPRRGPRRDGQSYTFDEMLFKGLRDSGRLLIIDEAHRLANSGLEFLRDLHDECRVPILLFATKDLMDRLEDDKDEDHGQLFSRFAMFLDIVRRGEREPENRKPLFTLADIRRLYESDKVRLLPDGQRYLQDVANMLGHGSLRRCDWIVKWAEALERRARGLNPEERASLGAEVLRKAEKDAMRDARMIEDIDHRERIRSAVAV